jgi:hypothetical protein
MDEQKTKNKQSRCNRTGDFHDEEYNKKRGTTSLLVVPLIWRDKAVKQPLQ